MLGSDLVKYLNPFFSITQITKENYTELANTEFDVLINANGNSKRFWANQNPLEDFVSSTQSVYKSIFDFPCNLYIYISSPDVYENHTHPSYTNEEKAINYSKLLPYGFNKYLSELIVKKYKEQFLILRPSMILGRNLKKGPFYDILNNIPLHISLESKLQLITTFAIAEIIKTLLKKKLTKQTLNIGGIGVFNFSNVVKYFDRNLQVLPESQTQIYEMNIKKIRSLYPKLKTSEEYLKEFLNNYL